MYKHILALYYISFIVFIFINSHIFNLFVFAALNRQIAGEKIGCHLTLDSAWGPNMN